MTMTDEQRAAARAHDKRMRDKKVDQYKAKRFTANHVLRWREFDNAPPKASDELGPRLRYLVMKIMQLRVAVDEGKIEGVEAYRVFEAQVEELNLGELVPVRIIGPGGTAHDRSVSDIIDNWFRREWFTPKVLAS